MNPFFQNMLVNYQSINNFNNLIGLLPQRQFQAPLPYSYFPQQLMFQPTYNHFPTEEIMFLTPPKVQNYAKVYNLETSDDLEEATMKTEDSSCKIESSEHPIETPFKHEEPEPIKPTSPLMAEILNMVRYMLNEFGKAKKEEVENHRKLYAHNEVLCKLFDCLTEKFSLAAKCREDMVRFVLRKALTSLRDSLRTKNKISAKQASLELCRKYFNIRDEEKTVNLGNEDETLNFLLPYKKNSRNKTANTRFMTEIFSSGSFYEDYKEYLKSFDSILESENQKKVKKFVNFLEECVQKNSFEKIKDFKRLPWLKVWLDATKIIAYELLNNNTNTCKVENQSQSQKKVKTQKK